eukprot:7005553-Lingulodinium_polyedra.AAC.1
MTALSGVWASDDGSSVAAAAQGQPDGWSVRSGGAASVASAPAASGAASAWRQWQGTSGARGASS